MKVFDCFMFFNELDLIEIRFQELWDVVDYFVISEADVTHSNIPKPFYFKENWDRFKPYHEKIRLLSHSQMPNDSDPMIRDRHQRWLLKDGLKDLTDQDLVITSDLDEIPRAQVIELIKNNQAQYYDRYILKHPLFKYKLNFIKIEPIVAHSNIIVTRANVFTNNQQEREYTFPWNSKPNNTHFVDHGGWSWSYYGDDEHCLTKIRSFAHAPATNIPALTENHSVDWFVKNKNFLYGDKCEYVILDDYFPKCITDNLDKYHHMIVPDAELTVFDLYP